jgi:hypothetical protein
MKINELILENSVDEGIGQTIGKTWGGLAKGVGATVGGLAGTWDAAKQGYAAGKSAVTGKNADGTPVTTEPAQGGGTAPAPTSSTPPAQGGAPATGNAAPGPGSATPPAQGGAPAADAGQDHGLGKQSDGKFIKPGQKFDTASGSPIVQPPANAPEAPAQGGAPAAEPAAPAAEPAAPAAPVGMKADEIVKGLSDVWGKARASQDSKTGAPAVQQQIRAMGKEAGMAGQTFENRKSKKSVVEFRSNFLGMKI